MNTLKQWLQELSPVTQKLDELLSQALVMHSNKEAALTGKRSPVKLLHFLRVSAP
jgi:hypothetical protein